MAHPVVHFEIGCENKQAASAFYSQVFGWKIDDGPMGLIDTGTREGVQGHITSLGHAPHQYTRFYIQTDDVEDSLARVVELGGKIVVPPVTIPAGTFGWFSDLEGNVIGLWKPA